MPVVAATSKSVAFGDFSKYQIRDVNGVRLARLSERYLADEGKIGFLGWHRTDGALLDPTAVKVLAQHV
jgi:HK97 family phage major capsid protein